MLKWLGTANLAERGLKMGTKLITAVLFLFFLLSSSPSHATLIKLYDLQGTADTSYDNLTQAELWMGVYDYIWLATIPKTSFNTIVTPTGNGAETLIALLNRTYVPWFTSYGSPWGDASAMLVYDFFAWQLLYLGGLDHRGHGGAYSYYGTLYDLSGYNIESLYINSSFIEVGNSTAFKFDLLAEVEPIPEPSTMVMLSAGLLALIAFRRKKMENA